MSSRRSSSQTSRASTLRAPKWKTSGLLSSQPATSISKIFAQPLQGSPLRSAIDQLPVHTVSESEDSQSTIRDDDMSSKHERSSISSGGEHESPTTLAEDGGSRIASSAVSVVTKDEGEQDNHDSAGLEARIQEEPQLPPTQPIAICLPPSAPTRIPSAPNSEAGSYTQKAPSPPSRPPWFGSMSRSRGRPSSITSATYEPPSSPKSVDFPKASVHPQSQPITPAGSPPTSAPFTSSADNLRNIDTTSPKDLPSNLRPLTPHRASDPVSVVSSVDDEVPVPKVMVVQTDTPVKTPEVVTRKVSVSGLNPSSSRFVLRIPLLGRPKTPLQEVIAHPREETLKAKAPEEQPIVPETVTLQSSSDNLVQQASPSHELAAPAELAPEAAEEPPAANAEGPRASSKDQSAQGSSDTSQSSSTWWTYVGWSPSGSTTEVNNQQPNAEQSSVVPKQAITEPSSSTTPDLQLEQGAESEPSEPTSAITNTPSTTAKEVPSRVAVGEEKETETGKKLGKQQTPSLFFEDTTRSQYSAWYSPWGWYAASPIVPSSSSAPAKSPPKEGQSATEPYQMTESEMVREEALARDAEGFGRPDPAPGVPSDQVLNTVDTSEPPATLNAVSPSPSVNPIESSISSNRSGWASFFMSKALLVKNITDGQEAKAQDQGEMEVMDIDEDDGQVAGRAQGGDVSTEVAAQLEKEKVVASTSSPSKPVGIASRKSRSIASTPASTSTSPKVRDSARPPLKEREPKKSGPPAPPLTNSDSIKKETAKVSSGTRPPSPTPSKYSTTPPRLSPPNLVLPTWNDTFQSPPRSLVPPPPTPPVSPLKGKFEKTLDLVSILWSGKNEQDRKDSFKSKGKERQKANPVQQFGMDLPKALDVAGHAFNPKSLNDKCRVVVIGVAGWMPGAITRTLAGGLPSSSSKFVDLTCTALQNFEEEHGFKFQKITKIPLEGDGTIERKLSKIHSHLMGNEEWMRDLHSADVIFVAAHSQGSIVSAHLIDRLIKEGHIMTERNMEIIAQAAASVAPGGIAPSFTSMTRTQKICCLALCGVHLGPLRYLKTSSLLQPYLQYFENAAARELFDFQDTETDVSKNYVKALSNVMDHGTKMLYVASLNDQVVPIYSGLFSAASHPRILRALYIDGDAYHSSDFLSNLLVLLIRIMNTGLSDSGLLAHLSEATAGTLSGVGHSTAYEELASYSLAVNYLFLTNDGGEARQDLVVEPFNAVNEQNDYEIPWSLRDLIADERVAHFFAAEFEQLKDAFNHWSPKTTILRDVKRKLQPIQRLTSIKGSSFGSRL